MTNPEDQDGEPVAYLGGKTDGPPDDAPIEGYLGGEAAPDSLPALPPAEPSYSATDFIEPPADAPPEQTYADYAAEPPVEAPAADETQFEQYAQDQGEQTDYGDSGTQTLPEEPAAEASSDMEEAGLPKTISQQDAENIIKRITTKKILPPEVAAAEGPRINPPSEMTPRGSGKLGKLAVVLLILFVAAGAAVFFKEDLRQYAEQYLPEDIFNMFYDPKQKTIVEPPKEPPVTPEMKAEDKFRDKVLDAEARAFSYDGLEAFLAAQKDANIPPPERRSRKPQGTGDNAPDTKAPDTKAPNTKAPDTKAPTPPATTSNEKGT